MTFPAGGGPKSINSVSRLSDYSTTRKKFSAERVLGSTVRIAFLSERREEKSG